MISQARWIYAPQDIGTVSPIFRKTVQAEELPVKATVYATAMGVYELLVNGKRVGDALMTPGWTSYNKRVQYQEYDILPYMRVRSNKIDLCAGKGWAVGRIGFSGSNKGDFSDHICVLAEIVLEYADGTREVYLTNDTWQVYTSKVLFSELYDGETYDATAEEKLVGNASVEKKPTATKPIPQVGEYVREHERVAPVELIVTPKGERVIDFGQNLAGYVEIRIKGKKGSRIVLSHAEVLDSEGNFYTGNYRSAKNRIEYVLSGGEDVFKPHFCFQGYRYIRLDEFPTEEVDLGCFTSVAIYSDMKRTGHFACGDNRINQLYSNILWGQRSNFVDVPTDCPQRDERLGWTGDAQVFCRTASINYNTEKFYKKWLGDMMLDQGANGSVEGIIPILNHLRTRISTAWGDAAAICPWEVYLAYGNRDMLRTHFDMMKKWVEFMHGAGEEEYLWMGGIHYGDWLAMDFDNDICEGGTQTDLIASAFFAYSTELVIRAGRVLGEDVSYFENMHTKVRSAFRRAFMKDGLPVLYPKCDGLSKNRPVLGETQTAIVLILRFGLYEESEREKLVNRLVEMIEQNDGRMTTGFVGTPYILHVLTENGRQDIAYNLLFQEKNPSWLFSVNHGATTMWEHWNSLREDGSFWSTTMNSFNHYAYGAVFDWIFGAALGIKVLDEGAGYSKVTVKPHTDRRLGFAEASIETAYGTLNSAWRYRGDEIRFDLTIPDGCEAEVELPGGTTCTLTGGTYLFIEKARD